MKKGTVRIFIRALLYSAIAVVTLLLVLYALLWIPPVQQKIKDIALSEVMKMTNNQLSIGKLSLRPFSQLKIEDVYASDLNGDTLLYAKELSAGFSLWSLLQNKLLITSVELDNFVIHVSQDSVQAPFNFQFLVDAFASTDTTKKAPSSMIIEIDDIAISNGTLTYDVKSAQALTDMFDPNHIQIQNLQANIDLKNIDLKNLDVNVRLLAFKEKSGFELKHLSGKINSDKEKILLKDLVLQLPDSELKIDRASVDYTGMEIGQLINGATYSLSLQIPKLNPIDLKAFYPPIRQFTDILSMEGKVSGTFPEINLEKLQANYGKHISLLAAGKINNYTQWEKSPFDLTIEQFSMDPYAIEMISTLGAEEKPQQANTPFFLQENITLTAQLSGSLPALNIDAKASTLTGEIALKGTGGYIFNTGEATFDINLSSDNFNLKHLMKGNSSLGLVNMELAAKGGINKNGNLSVQGNTHINRFDFNQYAYKNIDADVTYSNDTILLQAVSNDLNLPLKLNASLDMRTKSPHIKVYAALNHANLKAINLVTEMEKADIYTVLNADIKGTDLEAMTARITIDSMSFSSGKDTFNLKPIKLNYQALPQNKKSIQIAAGILDGNLQGEFSFGYIANAFTNTLAEYLPGIFKYQKIKKEENSSLTMDLEIHNTEPIMKTLNIPFSVMETARIKGAYNQLSRYLNIEADLPLVKINDMLLKDTKMVLQTDTTQSKMQLSLASNRLYETADSMLVHLDALAGGGNLDLGLSFRNVTPKFNLDGSIAASAHFENVEGQKMADIFVNIKPTTITMNQQVFRLEPAELSIKDKEYTVKNLRIAHSENEFIQINGIVSNDIQDTLKINLAQIQLQTLAEALKLGVNVKGEINGGIIVNQMLTEPRIITDGFSIKDISLEDKVVGSLELQSGWSEERQGLQLQAVLKQENNIESTITGMVLPAKDSLSVTANIQSIKLEWLKPFTQDFLFGLAGEAGAKIKATGKLSKPLLSGIIFLKDANLGVRLTNVQYNVSDSLFISPDRFAFKNFRIKDEKGKEARINGEITHKDFLTFKPDVKMEMEDFLVLNNSHQTDSLFYGTLKLNGSANVTGTEKDLVAKLKLQNSGDGRIFVNLPEGEATAQQYNSITFINPNDTLKTDSVGIKAENVTEAVTSLPIKLEVDLTVDDNVTLGAIINPETRDNATIQGAGKIKFSYDMSKDDMKLLGDYTISNGRCIISIKNVARREFKVKPNGIVRFNGDPTKTSFDIAAVYSVRADLAGLDQSFITDSSLPTTKVMVNCVIGVSGDVNNMKLSYNIELPNSDESVQRKLNAMMPNDNIKIKEIAYLLAFSMFYPNPTIEDNPKPTSNVLLTSLASSSINAQLNNLLGGVLKENWSIGTELHSSDDNMSNLEMDVNVSTSLFGDRVILSSNIGYKNSSTTNTNFTGDFDAQFKLTKSGDLVLKMYNVTNDQYYEQALYTQGVGIVYKKEAKTFKSLFKKIKNHFKK